MFFVPGQNLFSKKGRNIELILQGNWDYLTEEKKLNACIFNFNYEVFSELKTATYKIPLAIGFYDQDEKVAAYLKRNIKKAVKYIIDENNIDSL